MPCPALPGFLWSSIPAPLKSQCCSCCLGTCKHHKFHVRLSTEIFMTKHGECNHAHRSSASQTQYQQLIPEIYTGNKRMQAEYTGYTQIAAGVCRIESMLEDTIGSWLILLQSMMADPRMLLRVYQGQRAVKHRHSKK
jgi:hypothetical protein